MLSVLGQVVNIIDQYAIWLYAACLVVALLYLRAYLVARREQVNTTFTIEKEVAVHREGRAMTGIGLTLVAVVALTAVKYYLMPTLDVQGLMEPTPTHTLPIPTLTEPTATPTPEPSTPTPRPEPTSIQWPTSSAPQPQPTSVPAAATCPDPNVCLARPVAGQTVSGLVSIVGTANHGEFQFYKVEYGIGSDPAGWFTIGDVHRSPVINGQLAQFNTSVVPNGALTFRLTVVDKTGNYPTPYRVTVQVQN